jgi:hypothetical protein
MLIHDNDSKAPAEPISVGELHLPPLKVSERPPASKAIHPAESLRQEIVIIENPESTTLSGVHVFPLNMATVPGSLVDSTHSNSEEQESESGTASVLVGMACHLPCKR